MCLDDEIAVLILLQAAFTAIFMAAILLTTRHQTAARLASVAALAAVSRKMQTACLQLLHMNPHWRAIAAPLCWIQFLSASEWILVARASNSDFFPPPPQSTTTTTTTATTRTTRRLPFLSWTRAWASAFAVASMPWNLRRVNTSWQVKNTPPAGVSVSQQTSRASFLCHRAATTLLTFITLDMLVSGPPPDPALVGRQKQALWWNLQALTLDDCVFRIIGTASFWTFVALLLLVINNCGALLAVVCGLCTPNDCPPLFGPFTRVTSIRRFWGRAWHQCLRACLTGHANLVAESVFRIPRRTSFSTYTRLWLAFLISGLVHYTSDLAMGIEPSEAGSPLFFSLQALGIMLEDAFQVLTKWCRMRERVRILRWLEASGMGLILGQLWVVVFLVWSTPTWFYPQQRLGLDATRLLPVRIIPAILRFVGE